MRVTQGMFSFLPDLTDEQIEAQIHYALRNGWAISVEYTDDPHPRNAYWELWNLPLFDLRPDQADVAMREVQACRERFPHHYVKVIAYDATYTRQTTALAFIVGRPAEEPGFRLERTDGPDRSMRYALHGYAAERPAGRRYAMSAARSEIDAVLDQLDAELVALQPVKTRIREIAALLAIERLRREADLTSQPPSLHMCFTGNPGTGKTTVALRMAEILHRLGYVEKGHLVSVTREELVGQYVGHTAPKTKDVLKRAYGGVLFIDEAYYLHRPDNERDYGQEAIEILLQVMENDRDRLVVILAGYKDRMDEFFGSNPGMASRVVHHIDFPDYTPAELMEIAQRMLERQDYRLSPAAQQAFREYLERRMQRPRFAHGRSTRNALDRARLRHAGRLFAGDEPPGHDALMTIEADDIYASSIFRS